MHPPTHTDHGAGGPAGDGPPHRTTRRDLLKYTAGGVVALGLGGAATLGRAARSSAAGTTRHIALWASEGFRTMIDGTRIYVWAFSDTADGFGTRRGPVPPDDPFNGVPQPLGPTAEITHPEVAVRAKVGQTVLVRALNAGYFPTEWNVHPGRVHGERLDVQVVASDGRPFVATDAAGGVFHPRFARQTISMGPAERYDCVVTATTPDVYPVTIDTLDWVSLEDAGQPHADRVRGTARTTITFTD